MRIDLQVDVERLRGRLGLLEKQMAYAVVNALNTTAPRAQEAVREHARHAFQVRRPFTLRQVAILKKASTKGGRPFAELWVGTKADTSKGGYLLLSTFEAGGPRPNTVQLTPPSKSQAIPLLGRPARPSIAGFVPAAFTFAGMHLVEYKTNVRQRHKQRGRHWSDNGVMGEFGRVRIPDAASAEGKQFKGNYRTFELLHTKKEPFGGVFQRIGPARGDIREIWAFRQGIKLDDRLKFVETVQETAEVWLQEDLEHQINLEVAYNLSHGR